MGQEAILHLCTKGSPERVRRMPTFHWDGQPTRISAVLNGEQMWCAARHGRRERERSRAWVVIQKQKKSNLFIHKASRLAHSGPSLRDIWEGFPSLPHPQGKRTRPAARVFAWRAAALEKASEGSSVTMPCAFLPDPRSNSPPFFLLTHDGMNISHPRSRHSGEVLQRFNPRQ